jgi:hypothetical protein
VNDAFFLRETSEMKRVGVILLAALVAVASATASFEAVPLPEVPCADAYTMKRACCTGGLQYATLPSYVSGALTECNAELLECVDLLSQPANLLSFLGNQDAVTAAYLPLGVVVGSPYCESPYVVCASNLGKSLAVNAIDATQVSTNLYNNTLLQLEYLTSCDIIPPSGQNVFQTVDPSTLRLCTNGPYSDQLGMEIGGTIVALALPLGNVWSSFYYSETYVISDSSNSGLQWLLVESVLPSYSGLFLANQTFLNTLLLSGDYGVQGQGVRSNTTMHGIIGASAWLETLISIGVDLATCASQVTLGCLSIFSNTTYPNLLNLQLIDGSVDTSYDLSKIGVAAPALQTFAYEQMQILNYTMPWLTSLPTTLKTLSLDTLFSIEGSGRSTQFYLTLPANLSTVHLPHLKTLTLNNLALVSLPTGLCNPTCTSNFTLTNLLMQTSQAFPSSVFPTCVFSNFVATGNTGFTSNPSITLQATGGSSVHMGPYTSSGVPLPTIYYLDPNNATNRYPMVYENAALATPHPTPSPFSLLLDQPTAWVGHIPDFFCSVSTTKFFATNPTGDPTGAAGVCFSPSLATCHGLELLGSSYICSQSSLLPVIPSCVDTLINYSIAGGNTVAWTGASALSACLFVSLDLEGPNVSGSPPTGVGVSYGGNFKLINTNFTGQLPTLSVFVDVLTNGNTQLDAVGYGIQTVVINNAGHMHGIISPTYCYSTSCSITNMVIDPTGVHGICYPPGIASCCGLPTSARCNTTTLQLSCDGNNPTAISLNLNNAGLSGSLATFAVQSACPVSSFSANGNAFTTLPSFMVVQNGGSVSLLQNPSLTGPLPLLVGSTSGAVLSSFAIDVSGGLVTGKIKNTTCAIASCTISGFTAAMYDPSGIYGLCIGNDWLQSAANTGGNSPCCTIPAQYLCAGVPFPSSVCYTNTGGHGVLNTGPQSINLASEGLSGSIPLDVVACSWQNFTASNNILNGGLLNVNLVNGGSMDLSYNSFYGTLPALTCGGNQTIKLGHNGFTGGLANVVFNPSCTLDLSYNQIGPVLPFFNISANDTLKLAHNSISSFAAGWTSGPVTLPVGITVDFSYNNITSYQQPPQLVLSAGSTIIFDHNPMGGASLPPISSATPGSVSISLVNVGNLTGKAPVVYCQLESCVLTGQTAFDQAGISGLCFPPFYSSCCGLTINSSPSKACSSYPWPAGACQISPTTLTWSADVFSGVPENTTLTGPINSDVSTCTWASFNVAGNSLTSQIPAFTVSPDATLDFNGNSFSGSFPSVTVVGSAQTNFNINLQSPGALSGEVSLQYCLSNSCSISGIPYSANGTTGVCVPPSFSTCCGLSAYQCSSYPLPSNLCTFYPGGVLNWDASTFVSGQYSGSVPSCVSGYTWSNFNLRGNNAVSGSMPSLNLTVGGVLDIAGTNISSLPIINSGSNSTAFTLILNSPFVQRGIIPSSYCSATSCGFYTESAGVFTLVTTGGPGAGFNGTSSVCHVGATACCGLDSSFAC